MNFLPSFPSILSFSSLSFSLSLSVFRFLRFFSPSLLPSLPVCSRFPSPSFIFPSFFFDEKKKKGEKVILVYRVILTQERKIEKIEEKVFLSSFSSGEIEARERERERRRRKKEEEKFKTENEFSRRKKERGSIFKWEIDPDESD